MTSPSPVMHTFILCVYVNVCECEYVCVYICVCMCVYICVCVHVCMHVIKWAYPYVALWALTRWGAISSLSLSYYYYCLLLLLTHRRRPSDSSQCPRHQGAPPAAAWPDPTDRGSPQTLATCCSSQHTGDAHSVHLHLNTQVEIVTWMHVQILYCLFNDNKSTFLHYHVTDWAALWHFAMKLAC